ncbi:urocanate hydratase [Serinibacter arcticus]|uniref:Urocanate hydratase n=1 Tax=Serinibacter arcticus TaxID=1655435 RepID=A0A2U1ZTX3_9MICO|nr:urocanate hydratase [Serinibacter arcticus]PWD50421.1 urocanate hydratase [Serinibacter arcticus]
MSESIGSAGSAGSPAPSSPLLARGAEPLRAHRGTALRARSWRAEGLLRMFENVLEVGENPAALVVYASLGKAARDWDAASRIATALLELDTNDTLILQSGLPVGTLPTGDGAPLVLSAVNNTVGNWATADRFYERYASGQTIWGGLTAAAWQYIGRQGVLAGTYELLGAVAARHFGGREREHLRGRFVLTAGMGGMGSSQPISAAMLGLSSLTVEVDGAKIDRLVAAGGLDVVGADLDEALAALTTALEAGDVIAVGLLGNAVEVFEAVLERGLVPDVVTDQTAAHDVRFGYLPAGYALEGWAAAREADPQRVERDARASIARQVEAMLTFAERGSIVFENGNNLRVQAIDALDDGVHLTAEARAAAEARILTVPGFMEGYLRPLFARGIGPFRWVALSGDARDLDRIDAEVAAMFPARPEIAEWIALAREHVPEQGLPARSCWLGLGERSAIAVRVNELVAAGELSAPVLFSRDHLDAASMTHPRIGTEGMRDGSDGVTDWPLLDAMVLAATGADLVAIHSGGGGYAGWMQSAGVSIVADGDPATAGRLVRSLDGDSGLGVLRHAQAGYPQAHTSAAAGGETGLAPVTWFGRIEGADVRNENA